MSSEVCYILKNFLFGESESQVVLIFQDKQIWLLWFQNMLNVVYEKTIWVFSYKLRVAG